MFIHTCNNCKKTKQLKAYYICNDCMNSCYDIPDFDATDAAHPAWWRGHDHTMLVVCQLINAILDHKDNGKGVAREPWESTRRRLLKLANERSSSDVKGTSADRRNNNKSDAKQHSNKARRRKNSTDKLSRTQ